jgi:hypothetical protein
MDVNYVWSLMEDDIIAEPTTGKKKGKKIPLNEVFSIVPMNGIVSKGSTETITMTFSPGQGVFYNAKAKCEVEGGPEYFVNLKGGSNDIKCKICVKEDPLMPVSDNQARGEKDKNNPLQYDPTEKKK